MKDYKKESLSLIVTVFNEAATIEAFLESVLAQRYLPDELVIVDNFSADGSFEILKNFKTKQFKYQLIRAESNRSQGRNLAVKKSQGNLLAISDAGCILEADWLEKLMAKRKTTGAAVIAGYYRGLAQNKFQLAAIPYFLVMPDKLDPATFLPATRSMLIEKKLWESIGGLDENLNYSEDYQLAKKIKAAGVKIELAPAAIVNWLPVENLRQFFSTIFSMAAGDLRAAVLRPKVLLVFWRYLLFLILILINFKLFLILFALYLFWAGLKNYRYCPQAAYYLPLLQIVADLAVMTGTLSAKLI